MLRSLLFLLACPALIEATNWYVSPGGSDSSNGTSLQSSFQTIQKAANMTQPGDTVLVAGGTYSNSCAGCDVVDITRSGTAAAWIVYQPVPGQHPVISFNGWTGFNLHGGASYIRITGFEIRGTRAQVRYETCIADSLAASPDPLCNGNGIFIDGRQDGAARPHHIQIDHNRIWQCAGGGVGTATADYITVEDNEVSENAWYSRYGASGISYYLGWNFDNSSSTKMIIRGNIVYDNRAIVDVTAGGVPPYALSDGNCIIVDSNQNGTDSGSVPASGRTLVENNLVFDCGGGGVTVFASAHVDVFNNTTFMNSQVVDYGEIFDNQSSDVQIENNICYSRPGATTVATYAPVALVLDYNLYFNGALKNTTAGAHDLVADPLFTVGETDFARADYHPLPASPAIGSALASVAPPDDVYGQPRPALPSRGAIEPRRPRVRQH